MKPLAPQIRSDLRVAAVPGGKASQLAANVDLALKSQWSARVAVQPFTAPAFFSRSTLVARNPFHRPFAVDGLPTLVTR